MIKNYLTTAFRALWRSKGSTLINISGLTLGITASLILFLLIRDQQGYDNYHVNRDRIYRVVSSTQGNEGRDYSAGVPAVLPEAVRTDFPEAEQVVFTSYRSGGLVTIPATEGKSKKYDGRRLVYTQPAIFLLFDRTISGGTAEALKDPNMALISYRSAAQYFGQQDVIGKTLIFEGHEFKVAGLVSDPPANTDFGFDVFLSYVTIRQKQEENGWNSIWSDEQCYVLLRPDATAEVMDKEGWFHTGDIGIFVENRFLKITDRKKEIFKTSGGKYIAPVVIENKLKESPFIEQVMVIGEGEKFASALIVPAFVVLKEWCERKNIPFESNEKAIENSLVIERIMKEVAKVNVALAQYEKIKNPVLLSKEWTIEGGELTPKMSMKRKVIMKNNESKIAAIYAAEK